MEEADVKRRATYRDTALQAAIDERWYSTNATTDQFLLFTGLLMLVLTPFALEAHTKLQPDRTIHWERILETLTGDEQPTPLKAARSDVIRHALLFLSLGIDLLVAMYLLLIKFKLGIGRAAHWEAKLGGERLDSNRAQPWVPDFENGGGWTSANPNISVLVALMSSVTMFAVGVLVYS